MLVMNEIKLVYGAPGNRKFSTPARQRELFNGAQHTKEKWFEVDDNAQITASDIVMSVGVYVAMPIMAISSIVLAIKVC